MGAGQGRPGGRLLPGCGTSGVRRSPTLNCSSSGACCRGPLSTGCGCGGCLRGDLSPTWPRGLLRAGFARCGGSARAPGGGASRLGVGRLGSSVLPTPTTRLFGRAAGAHYRLAVGAEDASLGTRHQPHRARSCLLALRAFGAARGRGGASLAWVWGVRGRARSQLRPLVLWGVLLGTTIHWRWVRGVRAWGPVTNPIARAHRSWLCVLWGQHKGAWGGRLSPGRGVCGVGRSPPPDCSSFGACAQGPLPTGCGCRGCGRGDPSAIPPRARSCGLALRAVGAARGRPGGAPLAWLWGVRGPALSDPHALVLRGVLPGRTTHWLWVRRVRGWGRVTNPTARALASWLCALWGQRQGARGGRLSPGCGTSGVGRYPTPDRSSFGTCGQGPLRTDCGCGGCGRRDPSPTPPRALLGAGFARCGSSAGEPRGGAGCLCVGRPGSGALPTPTARPLGREARFHYPLAVGAGGAGVRSVTSPTARALASWLCALWGRQESARGGGLLPGCGVSGVGRSPTLDHSSFGACCRGPLSTGCGCGECGRRDPSPTPPRTLVQAGFARCGAGTRAPGGGRLSPGRGASGVGHSPTPDRSSFGACGQGRLPTGCGCRGCGRGDPSPTPSRALLQAGFARCGGSRRTPGGGASCLGMGRPGSGALPPRTARPLGRAAGLHYPLAVGAAGVGVGTPHQPHSARSCELAMRAEGAAPVCLGGAPLAWGRGVRGQALSHPGPPVLLGVRPGPTTHWLCVWGVWAWGPVTNSTVRALASWLCAPWGRQEGVHGGHLLPGCGASGSPNPDCSSFGACCRGLLPTGCGCGGLGHGDPSPTPPRALFFFLRAPVRTKFWAGAPPHAKYIEWGYHIQEGR